MRKPVMSRVTRVAAAGLAAIVLSAASGCAVLVNDHGNLSAPPGQPQNPYRHMEVAIGVRGAPSALRNIADKNIPIVSEVAGNLARQGVRVDEQGRTVQQLPDYSGMRTQFCYSPDGRGGIVANPDCSVNIPSNAGLHTQRAPDLIKFTCDTGYNVQVKRDEDDPKKTEYVVCENGRGQLSNRIGLLVNGAPYGKTCPSSTVAAFDVAAVDPRRGTPNYTGGSLCLKNS